MTGQADREAIWTGDSQAEGYVVLQRFRSSEPRAQFDLVPVLHANPPIRSMFRWAVVRKRRERV